MDGLFDTAISNVLTSVGPETGTEVFFNIGFYEDNSAVYNLES
jgi:hypothetical protein